MSYWQTEQDTYGMTHFSLSIDEIIHNSQEYKEEAHMHFSQPPDENDIYIYSGMDCQMDWNIQSFDMTEEASSDLSTISDSTPIKVRHSLN